MISRTRKSLKNSKKSSFTNREKLMRAEALVNDIHPKGNTFRKRAPILARIEKKLGIKLPI